jgi:uncharacterized membrane protein
MSNVLIAGESWITQSTHIKGVDSFTMNSYVEGVAPLKSALEKSGHVVTYLPGHLVPTQFPNTSDELAAFDVVVLSDIGANSIQLAPKVFEKFERGSDRLGTLAAWVSAGGGLLMIGGYLSFTGFEGKAAFRQTALAEVLPIDMLGEDDRVERPAGVTPTIDQADHAVLEGITGEWPHLLGYNRTILKADATLVASVGSDPLIAVNDVGYGRSAVFTSDCSPHWAPPEFCEQWSGYSGLFDNLITWLSSTK